MVLQCFTAIEIKEEASVSTLLVNLDNKFDPFDAMSTPLYQTATFKQVVSERGWIEKHFATSWLDFKFVVLLYFAAFCYRKWTIWLYKKWKSYTGCIGKVLYL